ncbi:MAG: DNA-processing protein DprA [Deltaproteobacteria bacterium]|nr:DNA-processing protein DprA [Deltaproteobacteria bacterium]
MIVSTPVEWLALQRRFCSSPKKGLDLLRSGQLDISTLPMAEAKKDWEQIQKMGLKLITWSSEEYPSLLREIYDPPLVLLSKGKWERWEERHWVGVVGARKATSFGKEKTKEFVTALVKEGIGIVSGLAYGIDSEAHKTALEAGGVTWGVLGTGPDLIYPTRHRLLAEKMCEQGGYLSEFALGTPPYAKHFPQRNRIISGLSSSVIIVEATLRSGSLISARFAMEQGREVFVVPPPRDEVAYEGNKKLLEDGATPLENVEQILEVIQLQMSGLHETNPPKKKEEKTKEQKIKIVSPILDCLKKPRSLETLVAELHMPVPTLLVELVKLESQGLVKKIPGPLWQSL